MARYALINDSTNLVVNVIELNVLSDWPVPSGHSLIQSDLAGIGWENQGGVLVNILPPPPPPPPPTLPLSVIQGRLDTEGKWDIYVNYMFATAQRRNAFLKTMFLGRPLTTTNNVAFRNTLLGAGLTQAEVDRIMAT